MSSSIGLEIGEECAYIDWYISLSQARRDKEELLPH